MSRTKKDKNHQRKIVKNHFYRKHVKLMALTLKVVEVGHLQADK